MENAYAQALWKSVQRGKEPKEAVSALVQSLKAQSRFELLPRIQRAFKRLVAAEKNSHSRIFVAQEKVTKDALAKSGMHDADVRVDHTLIGGWRMETRDTLLDHSFKKHLLSIYSNVTN